MEDVPLLEAQADELLGPLPALGQFVQRNPRLLEVRERVSQGRTLKRADPRLPAVAHRLLPQLPAQRVVGEALDLFIQPVCVESLDRANNLRVQRLAPLLQQAAVGHLVGQRVLEGVLQVREELRLVDELRFLQVGKAAAQDVVGLLRDGRQQ